MAKKKASKKRGKARAGQKAAAPKQLSTISTSELAREMARRQKSVSRLHAKREKLAAQLAELDQEIRSLGGTVTGGGGGGRRASNPNSLANVLLGVLDGKTMSVTEAAEAAQAAGYQTSSSSFRTIVNQTLIKDPRFSKVSRGQYTAG